MRYMLPLLLSIALLAPGAYGQSVPLRNADTDRGLRIVDRALRGDPAALASLRQEGPSGLQRLLKAAKPLLAKSPDGLILPVKRDPKTLTIYAAIDAVAAQHDAISSGLYWYTDFDQARAAAAREHKPILSLRLLGKLDQDLSCANSRFFRTTLYPDPKVNGLLRERFVLYWSSERPVPVVTIDFGDGRILKRTLGGNSVHYVLDEQGRPIDALPGLYSADEFVLQLKRDLDLNHKLAGLTGSDWEETLAASHRQAAEALAQEWKQRLSQAGLDAGIMPESADELVWDKLAAVAPVKLSPQVVSAISSKAPPIQQAERITASKAAVETPLVRALARLRESIARDTLRDEFDLHKRIHGWFCEGGAPVTRSFDALNASVYSRLFLTPRSDPWLGMAPADVYSGIENGGLASR